MRIAKTLAMAAGLTFLGAGGALAWGDIYMGDGTTRAGQNLVQPYGGQNNCPAGLQPVIANGEICCGVPNTPHAYYNRPGGKKKARKSKRHYTPVRMYAPEGVKGVVMR